MNLPNYFLADLPPEATLSPAMIREACQTLKHNRERYLAGRSTESLINVLSGVSFSWLQPDYPFRKMALDQGPAATGFSKQTLNHGLDAFFKQLTADAFKALLEQDLGHASRLDQMTSSKAEEQGGRAAVATAPDFLVHIAAGNLPVPSFMSIIQGVLVRSAQFVKCASGTALLPRLFAHSLYDAEPKLGACLELAEWPGGSSELEAALFEEADCVTATGSDESLASIQKRLPPRKRFLSYGHRVSFSYVAKDALTAWNAKTVAERATRDVVAWNQLGCLSPHVIYVQEGGSLTAEKFAELLADALAQCEASEPRGELPAAMAAAISSRRSFYEVRAAHAPDTHQWCSRDSTAWTVVYEADPRFQLSCLHRFVYVKGVKELAEVLQNADAYRRKISTVGLAVPDKDTQDLVTQLARWGATRICPIGQMQNPPLSWRHDGRPTIGDLITWTDWER
ncbi:MAG TPA: acyl-CoA reductase [Candidatus Limnocylindrales bacterium]|nr:acyl-CoA reductase [Candidatus Limnocylindrales bacterium]